MHPGLRIRYPALPYRYHIIQITITYYLSYRANLDIVSVVLKTSHTNFKFEQ
jgi:hypothetical protein